MKKAITAWKRSKTRRGDRGEKFVTHFPASVKMRILIVKIGYTHLQGIKHTAMPLEGHR